MKQKCYWLSLLALVLILSLAVTPALAYFTSNARADGAKPLNLGTQTHIEEYVKDLEKSVIISCDNDSNPVWVRAIAYVGEGFTLSVGGSGWTARSDGWYYYGSYLYVAPGHDPAAAPGPTQIANTFTVAVTGIPTYDEFPVQDFNVSVQYECIPVEFGADGQALPADWTNQALIVNGSSSPVSP